MRSNPAFDRTWRNEYIDRKHVGAQDSYGVFVATKNAALHQKMKGNASKVICTTQCPFVIAHKFVSSDKYFLPGS